MAIARKCFMTMQPEFCQIDRPLPRIRPTRTQPTPEIERTRMIKAVPVLASLLFAALIVTWAASENGRAISSIENQGYQVSKGSAIRVGYIGDSILQGNNMAAPHGLLISARANREITWTRALYPYFNIDTWIDPTDSFRHFAGMNAGLSGDTSAQARARMNAP